MRNLYTIICVCFLARCVCVCVCVSSYEGFVGGFVYVDGTVYCLVDRNCIAVGCRVAVIHESFDECKKND